MSTILQALYLLLPAYMANMAPVIFKRMFKGLAKPIDHGLSWKGKRLLGDHKTYRGFIVGIVCAILTTFVQMLLSSHSFFLSISLLNYNQWLLLGFLLGFGALLGDSLKSLIKRRMNIQPGKPFIPFDQIDFVLGALIVTSLFTSLSVQLILTALIVSFVLDVIVNHISFYLGIRGEKW